jgi:hypothetical protein
VPVQVEASGTRNWRMLCTLVARRCGLARNDHRVLVISGFRDDEALSEPVLKVLPLCPLPRDSATRHHARRAGVMRKHW